MNLKQNIQKKTYPLCLGSISKDFTIKNGVKKKCNCFFFVDYNIANTINIFDIHGYLMKES